MTKTYDAAVIGAATASLTARVEVAKHPDNYVVIDGGILGTTCARFGCMPSKSLISIAKAYHSRQGLESLNLENTKAPLPDYAKIMRYIRHLRDRFVTGVKRGMQPWCDHLIQKHARFIAPNTLDFGDETVIIATYSNPIINYYAVAVSVLAIGFDLCAWGIGKLLGTRGFNSSPSLGNVEKSGGSQEILYEQQK